MNKNKNKKEIVVAEVTRISNKDRLKNAKTIGEIPLMTYELKRNSFIGIS